MAKMITAFFLIFLGNAVFGAIMDGGGGVLATTLTSSVSSSATTMPVTSTAGFLSTDYLILGDEEIFHTGKTATSFTGCTRGYHSTKAAAHSSGTAIYTAEASAINNAMGFNVVADADSMGPWAIITVPVKFLFYSLPRMAAMSFTYLGSGFAFVSYISIALLSGLIIVVAMNLAGYRRAG